MHAYAIAWAGSLLVRLRFIPVSPGSKKWTRRKSTYTVTCVSDLQARLRLHPPDHMVVQRCAHVNIHVVSQRLNHVQPSRRGSTAWLIVTRPQVEMLRTNPQHHMLCRPMPASRSRRCRRTGKRKPDCPATSTRRPSLKDRAWRGDRDSGVLPDIGRSRHPPSTQPPPPHDSPLFVQSACLLQTPSARRPLESTPSKKFIGGMPMNPATKRFTG